MHYRFVEAVSAEAVSLALGYAKVAPSDIEAALVLYRHELYPQACYFLQQGVEKSSKAFGLLIGTMKPEEARKEVSHDSLKSLVLHLPEVVDDVKKELADLLEWLGGNTHLAIFSQVGSFPTSRKYNPSWNR